MPQEPVTLPKAADETLPETQPRLMHWLYAILVSAAVITGGSLIVNLQTRDIEARRQIELLQLGSTIRARLNRELSSVLYLTSGLSSYLTVRHDSLQRTEIESILAALYRDSRHVRNFAIAVGYTLTYVYPLKGNEKAVGLHYPDIPAQWPDVKRAIDSEQPVLIGPLNLVQGGSGLIYRVPVFIGNKYWGLVSSVIDAKSLLRSALAEGVNQDYELAIRGKDSKGMRGDVFWGTPTLFTRPGTQLIDVEVPGGKWVIALRSNIKLQEQALRWLHGLVWIFGLLLGWFTLMILTQRDKLARLALHDALTGLPNRTLAKDRVDHAMSILRRDPSRNCLLVFVDLDGFKLVNDRFGHKAGDIVLQQVALRISGAVRDTDTVSRWGGDEFIVFMENVDPAMATGIITKIRQAVETPIIAGSRTVKVGASIGTAKAPDDGNTLDALVRAADQRMYTDKETRKPVPTG